MHELSDRPSQISTATSRVVARAARAVLRYHGYGISSHARCYPTPQRGLGHRRGEGLHTGVHAALSPVDGREMGWTARLYTGGKGETRACVTVGGGVELDEAVYLVVGVAS